jgi:hypothetical protein
MKKYIIILVAIISFFYSCQSSKNNVVTTINNLSTNTTDVDKTNSSTIFNHRWLLVSYTDLNGKTVKKYNGKSYDFDTKNISFQGDYPNDCNSCHIKATFDLNLQTITVPENAEIGCTEMACAGMRDLNAYDKSDKIADSYNFVPQGKMSYSISNTKRLEIQNTAGKFEFIIAPHYPNNIINDLNGTSWEIVAYVYHKNQENKEYNNLDKHLNISFNNKGFSYSPDCNSCSYNLDGFSSKNGLISWAKKAEYKYICTTMACSGGENELAYNIISNGMGYKIENNMLIIYDNVYRLKLQQLLR